MSDNITLKTIKLPLLSEDPKVYRERYLYNKHYIEVDLIVYFDQTTVVIGERFNLKQIIQEHYYSENVKISNLPKTFYTSHRSTDNKFIISFHLITPFKIIQDNRNISNILV